MAVFDCECCLVIVSLCNAFDIESSSHLSLGFEDLVAEPEWDFLRLSTSVVLCTGSTAKEGPLSVYVCM